MAEEPTIEEQLWAFLQGELSEEDRSRLETAVEADPALEQALTAVRGTEQALRELLPNAGLEDARIDQLIQEFDADHAQTTETPATPAGKTIQFPFWTKLLGFAALISIVLVSLQSLPGGASLQWASLELVAAITRGGEDPSIYDRNGLETWYQNFQEDISSQCSRDGLDGSWTLAATLQPGADKVLLVHIEAKDRTGQSEEWDFIAQDPADLDQQRTRWATAISQDLLTASDASD